MSFALLALGYSAKEVKRLASRGLLGFAAGADDHDQAREGLDSAEGAEAADGIDADRFSLVIQESEDREEC